jgi:hypothetical protein
MTSKKVDWKALFLEARHLIAEEVRRHEVGCGCEDVGNDQIGITEGACEGLPESRAFLKKTMKVVSSESPKGIQ